MKRWLPALLIVALLAAFRILGGLFPTQLPNLQPLPALLLCGIVFLKGAQRWLLPLAAWVISYPATSIAQGYPIFGWDLLSVILGIATTAAIALWTRRHPAALPVLASSIVAALVFYFVTNLVSFTVDPLYAKTVDGFVRSQWTGPEGGIPTWIFLRNLLAANFLFSALFLLSRRSLPQAAGVPAKPAAAR
ncbi:hypothetical protein KBB96_16565 [Luteolibacter ambystomatis]|uniref:Uncharacterized protein n=1 Tax=Luteolibacter ambystomatis TaxID=2824561 RepID=A0A975G806_9BACT|nr:DUF6580 family putative transport protein [Luteolibacter ambystomatis]QUE50466.1 hypothetical protein KBB96_16565 [Luteolibacter ambystomatis]